MGEDVNSNILRSGELPYRCVKDRRNEIMTMLLETTIDKNQLGVRYCHFAESLKLKQGAVISPLTLAFETYGQLNAAKDNVILIHHSLSTGCHVACSEENPQPGWWDGLLGEGKAIDTSKFFVICVNNLGSCYGSTGPTAINPCTGKPYQVDFPKVSIEDMVHTQVKLLQVLGIKCCWAVIGGSMGGMLTLAWAHLYPQLAKRFVAISMSHKAYPLQIAHRNSQRQAIKLDANWQQGHYRQNPLQGLKLARMISHLFYRGLEEVDLRFANELSACEAKEASVVNYYHYNANKFAQQFDACSYLTFLNAMDSFNLEEYGAALFANLSAPVRIIATDSDVLYPARQQRAVVQLMQAQQVPVELIEHHSPYGHDAFLVDSEKMSEYIAPFLDFSQ